MTIPRLVQQSVIRVCAILLVKGIGLAGRVTLTRMVGPEGIGLYQIAYSFYGFALMLAGGLPTTLALATAKRPSHGWTFFIILSLLVGPVIGLASLTMFLLAPVIADLLGNRNLEFAIRSLAPALAAVTLLSLLRGYLQGLKQVTVIAVSEVVEQSVRYAVLLLLVWQLLDTGIERAVGWGMYGTVSGAIAAFAMLTLFHAFSQKRLPAATHERSLPASWFIKTSLLISATRLLIPASEFIDALLIPNRLLSAGYSISTATAMYGVIYGMGVIVVYTPTLLTGALSHTVSAQLAAAWQQGNLVRYRRLSRTILRAAWLWGLISGIFLYECADELSFYIFNTAEAGIIIRYLALIPMIVGFREVSTCILWARDSQKQPLVGLLTGIGCSVVLQYILVAIPGWGYPGACIGIMTLELVALMSNMSWQNRIHSTRKRNLMLALVDLVIIDTFYWGVSMTFHPSPETAGLLRFLFMSLFYFTGSGLYMYLRCIRKSLL
ncbi:hypothetical protein PSTEL_14090 [Paenibacillus stellifer]|uniref:Polysaccharide biosynthesis protein C-terminal domain-containing protein n=1 Tax=Paenibacillus stellifer TaxID=169760 RepID=A0A089LXR3_9BACL|nr:oligosaccharide flippase family protein [Paenibacillus stellifer]AIQ64053.1 hypothetical protein PSTEL_14090 [Paenibacillus stellifer]